MGESESDDEPAFREPTDFPGSWQKLPTADLQKVDLEYGTLPETKMPDDPKVGSISVPIIRVTRSASVDYYAHAELTKEKKTLKKSRDGQQDEGENDEDESI